MGDPVTRQPESGPRSQRMARVLAAAAALCLLPAGAGAGDSVTTTQTYTISGEVC